jgi:hypothetical protein
MIFRLGCSWVNQDREFARLQHFAEITASLAKHEPGEERF